MTAEEFLIEKYKELEEKNKALANELAETQAWLNDADKVIADLKTALKIFMDNAEGDIDDHQIMSYVTKSRGRDELEKILVKYGIWQNEETGEDEAGDSN